MSPQMFTGFLQASSASEGSWVMLYWSSYCGYYERVLTKQSACSKSEVLGAPWECSHSAILKGQ